MNKKAIMLRFLTALLLTLIVFGFAGCVGAKLFRVSDQAETNFNELVKEIIEVSRSSLPQNRPFIFIQDKDTLVYFVNERMRKVAEAIKESGEISPFKYTPECNTGTCICLCHKLSTTYLEDFSSYLDISYLSISQQSSLSRECEEFSCKKLPGVEITEGSEIVAYRDNDGPRRQTVNIIKCAGEETYCNKKGDVSVIFQWWDEKKAYEGIK